MAKRGVSERAVRFARDYVDFVEALKRQGVPEDLARQEARIAAQSTLYEDPLLADYDPAKGPCPTCGRG